MSLGLPFLLAYFLDFLVGNPPPPGPAALFASLSGSFTAMAVLTLVGLQLAQAGIWGVVLAIKIRVNCQWAADLLSQRNCANHLRNLTGGNSPGIFPGPD